MSKVSFTKLGLTKNQKVETITWNDQNIEVKCYLPVNDKLMLISNVVNKSQDDNNFINPVKIDIFTALEVVDFYTNISFTEKQLEDPCKLYDLLIGTGLYNQIIAVIPRDEYGDLIAAVHDSITEIYKYRNSALGILDSISRDYSNLDLDAGSIQQKLADPDNMSLLKDVLTKLG